MENESVTISFPVNLLEQIKEIKKDQKSLNEFVIETLTKEVQRYKIVSAQQTILKLRAEVEKRTGIHPDPVILIRELRESNENE